MQKEEKRAGKKPEHGQKWARVKTWLASALLWLAKLLCVIISGVALLLVARLIFAQTVYESENVKVVEIGLSIIGAAVAVWAGLNIANSIERKELEDLRARTDGVKKLVDNLDNIASIAYDTFLQALLRMERDDATAYFYREFSKRGVNDKINYYTLTKIEDLFGQVYNLHNTANHLDEELLQKAEEALEYIAGFETGDKLVKIYLDFRKAEFNYYCATWPMARSDMPTFLRRSPSIKMLSPKWALDCPGMTKKRKSRMYRTTRTGSLQFTWQIQ